MIKDTAARITWDLLDPCFPVLVDPRSGQPAVIMMIMKIMIMMMMMMMMVINPCSGQPDHCDHCKTAQL